MQKLFGNNISYFCRVLCNILLQRKECECSFVTILHICKVTWLKSLSPYCIPLLSCILDRYLLNTNLLLLRGISVLAFHWFLLRSSLSAHGWVSVVHCFSRSVSSLRLCQFVSQVVVSSCVRVRSSARKPSVIWVHSEQLKRSCTCPADFINSACVFHGVTSQPFSKRKGLSALSTRCLKNCVKLHLPFGSSAKAFWCISLEMLKPFWQCWIRTKCTTQASFTGLR